MDNIEVISDELANVTETSTKFDEELLESVTDKLRSIVGFASEQNLTEDVIVQVRFQTLSNAPQVHIALSTIIYCMDISYNTPSQNRAFIIRGSNSQLESELTVHVYPQGTKLGALWF